MAIRQLRKSTKKAVSAERRTPARTAGKRAKVAPAGRTVPAKSQVTTSAPKPASMTGPLPPIVTLKHLAEWAGHNHGVPKKQAIGMFTDFVEDIGRVLKKGSKIRISNLGILQVRVRPALPARKGRNPATGEEIQIKAKKASRQVAFRVAKTLRETI